MKPLIAKPHLFISYSRKNGDLAAYLYKSLSSAGFTVYYDKEKTLIGERFAVQIVEEVKRSDALVAIVSIHSAQSPWCQAELYHAHALNVMIAPIRVGTEQFSLAAPLELLLKEINYVIVTEEATYEAAANQIKQQLKGIRHRRYLRNLRNAFISLSLAALLILGWRFGIQTLNNRVKATERKALMERMKGSDAILTGEVIGTYAKQFAEDEDTISQLLLTETNSELPDSLRLNAHVLSTALLAPRKLNDRWFIDDINWQSSNYENGQLNEITFMKGVLKDIRFKNVSFSGVVWNQAPSSQSPGLMLSNLPERRVKISEGRWSVYCLQFASVNGLDPFLRFSSHFASISLMRSSSRLSQRISINIARSVELRRTISSWIDVRLMRE